MAEAPVSFQYRSCSWSAYIVLLILRVLLVLTIQPGYLHPDEFFQSVEVGAGDVYGLDVHRSWEFMVTGGGPLRSIAGLSPVIHWPLWISKHFFAQFSSKYNETKVNVYSGMDLITRILLPLRLLTFVYSLAVDVFILVASAHLRPSKSSERGRIFPNVPPIALLLYAFTTFGGLVLAGRTLANTWEMASVAVFGILFVILADHLKHKENVLKVTIILCIQAVLCGWATFLRCTYLVFIFPMALVEVAMVILHLRHRAILPSSLAILAIALTIHVCLRVDTIYFTRSDPFITRSMQNLVCIPCRFFAYNSRVDHLSEHGLHPYYLHLLINFPLIFGPVLGFWALWPSWSMFSTHTLMWMSIVFPLAFLSSVPHQEARFLLPLVPFVLIMVGSRLESWMHSPCGWKRKLCLWILTVWCAQQITLAIVYGSLHQAGVVSYLKSVPSRVPGSNECPVHLFYHTYMPPRFPLGRNLAALDTLSTQKEGLCNRIIDLAGSSLTDLKETLSNLKTQASDNSNNSWIINLIYPGSLGSLNVSFDEYGTVRWTSSIVGHLSFEDPPSLSPLLKQLHAVSLEQFHNILKVLRDQLSIRVITLSLA